MPVDVLAEVIRNTPLSADYNVLTLAAPAVAAPVEPGQLVMVAGGVGLAPFSTLADLLRQRGVKTRLFYGARRSQELFYLDSFRNKGVDLVVTTEDGSMGERGRVVAPLDRRLASCPAAVQVV